MGPSIVTVQVTQGSLRGRKYVFDTAARCVVGRAKDCDLQLPNTYEYADISRHHCLLEIDPPRIRVHDLGSRNGTYVNGERIGLRPSRLLDELAHTNSSMDHDLEDGDVLQIGFITFQVKLVPVDQVSRVVSLI